MSTAQSTCAGTASHRYGDWIHSEAWFRQALPNLANPTVASALFKIYAAHFNTNDGDLTGVALHGYHAADAGWTGNGNPPGSGMGDVLQTGITFSADGWYEFDVTDLVQAAYAAGHPDVSLTLYKAGYPAPDAWAGLRLGSDGDNTLFDLDGCGGANPPRIDLVYAAPPEPADPPEWPAGLPWRQKEGLRYWTDSGVLRSSLAGDVDRARRRSRQTRHFFRTPAEFTGAQMAAWEAFLAQIAGGVLPFRWESPVTDGPVVCRLVRVPQWTLHVPAPQALRVWRGEIEAEIVEFLEGA